MGVSDAIEHQYQGGMIEIIQQRKQRGLIPTARAELNLGDNTLVTPLYSSGVAFTMPAG